ncbi:hypothetical protein FKZ61_007595 [Litorilinea aerophila]|uniref:DUF7482 domain-containing protein n=1 Tax=Litorilinea aerophila TaxID=1204385 RepID=A0A540VHU3_9CHLR|nr:hypothetical protein [Litorilinea aerophila]MCC9075972.1 hypothetical protein [Litorilinea aerophila]OUC06497.1 hypothetical protein RY27_20655 [Litorilinea aerophila]
MGRNLVVTALIAVLMAGFVLAYRGRLPLTQPTIPTVVGYAAGQEIRFIHTEASDAEIAQVLTDMVGSPVLVVPALAQTPPALRGRVYVFTNGVRGGGPLDYQPDVFDGPPGTPEYRPLREIVLVTWQPEARPRVLTDAAQVLDAAAAGQVTLEATGVVVNMPFVTWPGGHR